MSGSSEMTGIEKQLILKYLADKNVSLLFHLVNYSLSLSVSPEKYFFIKDDVFFVNEADFPEKISHLLLSSHVRISFYFNKLGLYFMPEVQKEQGKFLFKISTGIKKIEDSDFAYEKNKSLKVFLFLNDNSDNSKIECEIDYKKLSIDKKIAVQQMFLEKKEIQSASIQGRVNPPTIIHMSEKEIFLQYDLTKFPFGDSSKLNFILSFPITGPLKERKIELKAKTERILKNERITKENKKDTRACLIAQIFMIKEEDRRFLQDLKF